MQDIKIRSVHAEQVQNDSISIEHIDIEELEVTQDENYENEEIAVGWSGWDTIIKWAMYAVIALTPLFFLPWGVYQASFNKQFFVSSLVLLAIFSCVGKFLREGKLVYRKGYFAIFLLLGAWVLSWLFSMNGNVSFFGFTGGETDSVMNIFSFLLVFFVISTYFTIRDIKKSAVFYFFGLGALLIFQFLQFFGAFPQLARTFNPVSTMLGFSIFLGANLIFILAVLLNSKLGQTKKRLLIALGVFVFIYLLLVYYSLTWALLAVATAVMLVLKIYCAEGRRSNINFLVTLLTIFIFFSFANIQLISLLNVLNVSVPNLPSEVSVTFTQNASIVKEAYLNSDSFMGGIKNMFVGSGPSTFGYEYLKHRSQALNTENFFGLWGIRFDQGYGTLLTYFVSLGVLGALAFFFFFIRFAYHAFKNVMFGSKDETTVILLPVMCYGLVALLFYNVSYTFMLELFVMTAMLHMLSHEKKETSLFASQKGMVALSLLMIALMAGSLFGLYFEGRRFVASVYYGAALQNTSSDTLDANISRVATAVSLDKRNDRYYRGLSGMFLQKLNALASSPVADPADFQARFQLNLNNAINSAQAAIDINNIDTQNYLSLAQVYQAVSALVPGADTQAVTYYVRARSLDPYNPRTDLSISRVHINTAAKAQLSIDNVSGSDERDVFKKQRDDAFIAAEKSLVQSLKLKPNYSDAHFLLAQILERQGRLKEAIVSTVSAKINKPRDIGVLFQLGLLYYRDGQINAAQQEFEIATALFPNYSNARYFLGLIYDDKDLSTKALEQFEKVLELNPSHSVVTQIIRNIKQGRSALNNKAPAPPPPEQDTEVIEDIPIPETGGAEE